MGKGADGIVVAGDNGGALLAMDAKHWSYRLAVPVWSNARIQCCILEEWRVCACAGREQNRMRIIMQKVRSRK